MDRIWLVEHSRTSISGDPPHSEGVGMEIGSEIGSSKKSCRKGLSEEAVWVQMQVVLRGLTRREGRRSVA